MPADDSERGHDIVVIGASAGGIEALKELVGELPEDLPAALFVVLHLPMGGTSILPAILDRAGRLPAAHVGAEGAEISPGRIYAAPPDFHIQLEEGRVEATAGPLENGPRVVGVILSGALDDGTLGLRAVKAHGGVTLVQDPKSALHTGMPESAIALSVPDKVARPSELGALIVELANDSIAVPAFEEAG